MSTDGPAATRRGGATPGELLFARYAYPPNELGYCGLGDGHELLDATSRPLASYAADEGPTVAARARTFDGAWPYLAFLAAAASVADPLDTRVTRAYWVGSDLLDRIDPAAFAGYARRCFAGQRGADWAGLNGAAVDHARPHHSFHVFTVYPWMGLLRRTGSPQALQVLDRCRIRWGRVLSVDGDVAAVTSRPLIWLDRQLGLGAERTEVARWSDGGRSLLGSIEPGQLVSLHWGWICDVLDDSDGAALRSATEHQLRLSNATIAPVVAEASC